MLEGRVSARLLLKRNLVFRLGKNRVLQIYPLGGHASIVPNFPCRAGSYTLPTNFSSARCKTAPYIKPILSAGQTLTLRFFGSARAEPSEFIRDAVDESE